MRRRLKISICLMAASLIPLMLAGFSGLAVAVTVASFTIAWVVARETRRRSVLATFAAGLAAVVLVSVTEARSGTIIVMLADWVVLCTALLVHGGIDRDVPPRRTLGANLRVTAVAALLLAGVALLSEQDTLLTAGLALSGVAAVAFALTLRSLID